ncbi:MAG TPA: hypothetical protein VFB04_14015 [Terriglobales bacterium]|nr:hypothetical protein [Terriglobales bacterium]
MNRCRFAIMFIVLAASVAVQPIFAAPAAAEAQEQAASESVLRGAFPTTLVKALDSKKLKDGDQVVLQTSAPIRSNGMLVPSGAKVYGHITRAQARSKGDSESSLAMAFDKIEVAKGKELPMKGVLQAVAPALPGSSPDTAGMMGGGQMMSGHGMDGSSGAATNPPPGGVAGPNSGIHSIDAGSGPHPILNNQSQGVLGFKNLEMDNEHVLTSSGKEVKLDGGTQMMVRVEIQIPTQ